MRKQTPKTKRSSPHTLRIIGGQWRGRKLDIADVEGLRPTGDRIRETLFNWLMPEIKGSYCLDLYSGSGALGLECLSRGAAQAILIEKHPAAIKQLRQHCSTLNTQHATMVESDCATWLAHPTINHLPLKPRSIDIVFIDPPFSADLWNTVITQLDDSKLLRNDALIYIEKPTEKIVNTPNHWSLLKEKKAGQVAYQLFSARTP